MRYSRSLNVLPHVSQVRYWLLGVWPVVSFFLGAVRTVRGVVAGTILGGVGGAVFGVVVGTVRGFVTFEGGGLVVGCS